MTVTEMILIAMIVLSLVFIVYDTFIIPVLKKKTVHSVPLKKRNLMDHLIFAGLLIILLISNAMRGGNAFVTYLLAALAVIFLYFALIHTPKARFKERGFFYGSFYFAYDRIKNMNLSEDGILVVDTERRRLLLHVVRLEDLQKILKVYTEH